MFADIPFDPHLADRYAQDGYAIVRGFWPLEELAELSGTVEDVRVAALAHGRDFRHGNLFYRVQAGPHGPHVAMAQWACWQFPALDAVRTHPRFATLLGPLLGPDLRQIIHQIHWKQPDDGAGGGGDYAWHQDSRSRRPAEAYRNLGSSYVQTGLALDRHDAQSGCLRVVPGSHLAGELDLQRDRTVLGRLADDADLALVGFGADDARPLLLEPGDLAIWSPFLLHASGSNRSSHYRRLFINGYARAADCDRGEWAFRAGAPVPLPDRPGLVHYEGLFDRPEPHYP